MSVLIIQALIQMNGVLPQGHPNSVVNCWNHDASWIAGLLFLAVCRNRGFYSNEARYLTKLKVNLIIFVASIHINNLDNFVQGLFFSLHLPSAYPNRFLIPTCQLLC